MTNSFYSMELIDTCKTTTPVDRHANITHQVKLSHFVKDGTSCVQTVTVFFTNYIKMLAFTTSTAKQLMLSSIAHSVFALGNIIHLLEWCNTIVPAHVLLISCLLCVRDTLQQCSFHVDSWSER